MWKYIFLLLLNIVVAAGFGQTSGDERLELCVKDSTSTLVLPFSEILTQATRPRPSQTGGSITALSATLGASLVIMSFQISERIDKDTTRKKKLVELGHQLKQELKMLSCFADLDNEIYTKFLDVRKLPAGTQKEKLYKDSCYQATLKAAAVLPIDAAMEINSVLQLTWNAIDLCSDRTYADLRAGVLTLSSAGESMLAFAAYNIKELNGPDAKSLSDNWKATANIRKTSTLKILQKIPD